MCFGVIADFPEMSESKAKKGKAEDLSCYFHLEYESEES